jgi:L-ascorbate metabolism protein UlaG (beta-lactamase superfamily)
MQITWLGMSCFEITALRAKGEYITILVDPLDELKTGIKSSKVNADIILRTNSDYVLSDAKKFNGAFLIDSPGEYEVKNVYVYGIASAAASGGETADKKEKKTAPAVPGSQGIIYTVEIEDIRICHLGNLQQAELDDKQISKIGNVDILMCPVGNGDGLEAKEALKVMSQIEPSIAIPMNYKVPQAKIKLSPLDDFLKEAGVGNNIEPLAKLTIKKKEINPEEAKIIVLSL